MCRAFAVESVSTLNVCTLFGRRRAIHYKNDSYLLSFVNRLLVSIRVIFRKNLDSVPYGNITVHDARACTVALFGHTRVDLSNPNMRSKRTTPKTTGIGIIITTRPKPNKKQYITHTHTHPERAISLSNHVVRSQTFRIKR